VNKIQANARTIRELLGGKKYQIDYYQREYKWEQKQVFEMIDDLVSVFLQDYRPEHSRTEVENYGRYFLGSTIISQRDKQNFIVDGQQRLTTLTLLLICLRQQARGIEGATDISDLIFSERFGVKSFNLQVDEREPALLALFDGHVPTENLQSESVQNLVSRYDDIVERFPYTSGVVEPEQRLEESTGSGERLEIDSHALPYFADWLIENVYLVEIAATSDDDAYTIFETMNDRGLSLSPADMLKGYVLANIAEESRRFKANEEWKNHITIFNQREREASADFFKSWLRSQYGRSIRTGSGRVQDHDYDRIGSEFHRWVRDENQHIGLTTSDDFYAFIHRDMDFFAAQYRTVLNASDQMVKGLEHVRYNANRGFTLQSMIIMAPLRVGDDSNKIHVKIKLVAMYLDVLLGWREWNYRRIGQSSMKVPIFNAMREIRQFTEPADLAQKLFDLLQTETENFGSNVKLRMNMQNRKMIHRMLARMTDYVERGAGNPPKYEELMSESLKNRYEVEHIWADRPERHRDEFTHDSDFREYRNLIGDLVLVPKKFNASYGDLSYADKLDHYVKQNLLAQSLHPKAYERDPGFRDFIRDTGLPFRSHHEFRKADIDARQDLFHQLANRIWDPALLLREMDA